MDEKTETTDTDQPQRAILFELENVAVDGRQIVHDVLQTVLAEKDITLTHTAFSRHCNHSYTPHCLAKLLDSAGKTKVSQDDLVQEIAQGIKLSFSDASHKLKPCIAKMLDGAASEQMLVGALSALDEDTAMQLSTRLGLDGKGVSVLSQTSDEKNFPSADAWLKLAKDIAVSPRLCLVIASSATACRAALSAGMRCVVVPDTFTAYQDFGGADLVADELDDNALEQTFLLAQIT